MTEKYSFEFTESNSLPFKGVIKYNGNYFCKFIIEEIFEIWFNFQDKDLNIDDFKVVECRRIKKFDEECYVDACNGMSILPCEFIIEIKNSFLEKLFLPYIRVKFPESFFQRTEDMKNSKKNSESLN